jgi:hypothetical protein
MQTLADTYWLHHKLSGGDRLQRREAISLFWSWEEVDAAMAHDDPLPLLDVLLRQAQADLAYLAAGPLEALLTEAPDRWDAPVAERCRLDGLWREAVLRLGLSHEEWTRLPALQRYLQAI